MAASLAALALAGRTLLVASSTAAFADDEADPSAISACPSGDFCFWGSTNYSGSLVTKSGDGATLTISSSVYSVYNNRPYAARLYNEDGSASICLSAGAKKPTVAAEYHEAEKVHLYTTTSC